MELIEIDPPINSRYENFREQCREFVNSISGDVYDFLFSNLSERKIRVLVGLPTSPVHLYLASLATTGHYVKDMRTLLLYYVKGFEDVFLRTFVHETGHVFFEPLARPPSEVSRDELVLYKVVDESVANYFVFRFECDKNFIDYVEKLTDFFRGHTVREGVGYHMAHIIAPRVISYVLYRSGLMTMETLKDLGKDYGRIISLLRRVPDESLRKPAASVLYSVKLIDDDGLGEFGFSPDEYQMVSLKEMFQKAPEEKMDELTTGIMIVIACLLRMTSTRGKEFVIGKFGKLFRELKRMDFIHKHFMLFLEKPQDFLGAMDLTVPGILNTVNALSEEDMIEMISMTFGV